MKNFLRLLSLTLFSILTIHCSTGQNLEAVKEKKEGSSQANALLWEIQGEENTSSSYLYGTIHIINDEDFFYPQGTMAAIENSEKMVFEIDMKEMNDMSQAMTMLQKAFMDDGVTLKDLLSEEEYDVVSNHFKKIGLPIFFLERIKPMFLSVFATDDFSPEDLQSGKIKSYEMEFAKIAEEKGMETAGLETIRFMTTQSARYYCVHFAQQGNS